MAKTVKVRIAVAVGPDGKWNCCGFSSDKPRDDQEMMSLAVEGVETGEARYWVEAELAVPEIVAVQGTATVAS